jgi:hypothetical protein
MILNWRNILFAADPLLWRGVLRDWCTGIALQQNLKRRKDIFRPLKDVRILLVGSREPV